MIRSEDPNKPFDELSNEQVTEKKNLHLASYRKAVERNATREKRLFHLDMFEKLKAEELRRRGLR